MSREYAQNNGCSRARNGVVRWRIYLGAADQQRQLTTLLINYAVARSVMVENIRFKASGLRAYAELEMNTIIE